MKNHYRYILIILLVILQSLHGYAFHSLKKVNVNAVTSDKIMHQRYASFVEFNSVNSFKKYSKKRGESICEVELWAANVIKVTDDTGRSRVIVIEEDYSTIHEYEIKFLNKENIYNVQ